MIARWLPLRSPWHLLRLYALPVRAAATLKAIRLPIRPVQATPMRVFSSSSMDAFMEFEREMAMKRYQANPKPIVARLKRPVPPKDDECCKLDCPNCVLLVYQEKLLEYEMSLHHGTSKPQKLDAKYTISFLRSEPSTEQREQLRLNDRLLYQVERNELISQPHKTRDGYVRSVRHIDLAVEADQHNHIIDDASNIAVFVPNDNDVVDRVIEHLKIDADLIFTINSVATSPQNGSTSSSTVSRPFDQIASVRDALTWSLDVISTPRTSFLRYLAAYTTSESDIKALIAPNALENIQASRQGQRITVADILDMFPSVHLDFTSFYQFAPLNAPRYYTVSSSRHLHPDTVSITLGLRKLESQPTPRCSSYLASLSPESDRVRATFFQSSFKFPRENRLPIMLISAGTGIAPFRAFLQDLEHEQASSSASNHREAYLFYGCRHRELDFLYEDDIQHAHDQGYLDGLFVEFSATPGQSKRYVQDALAEQGALVAKHLLKQDGYIFICGSLAMGRAAKKAIVQALREHSHLDEPGAQRFLSQCLEKQRVVTELW